MNFHTSISHINSNIKNFGIFQAYPRYQFRYSVSDDETKDQKSHQESRDGDNVEGEYSLVQPDGKTRIVTYTADKENG